MYDSIQIKQGDSFNKWAAEFWEGDSITLIIYDDSKPMLTDRAFNCYDRHETKQVIVMDRDGNIESMTDRSLA